MQLSIFNKFFKSFKSYLVLSSFGAITFLVVSTTYAAENLISLFPLEHYNQTISAWINPNNPDFDKPLLTEEMQQKRLAIFYDHYFGSLSPWNPNYVSQILNQSAPNDIKTIEQSIINSFSNEGKPEREIGYGENFRPYTNEWITDIANNISISQFGNLSYQSDHRGIAIDNLHARVLPTTDVHFYSYKLAGQGYPFDNLQMSALWAGTPVYIIGQTRDHAWMLVITPEYIGWVKSNGIARTDSSFVTTWSKAAKHQLAAITQTKTSIVDDKGNFLFLSYIGSVFPVTENSNLEIMVPASDTNHRAIIKKAFVSPQNASIMPLAATPHHFANIMKTMINRPYGWGSMYFYNDCSAELKSLLTPFGIWLPRHSSAQVTAGKMVDMSSASADKRLSYLMEHGEKFLTIVYIGGHVFLYVGNYPSQNGSTMAMTYQNIWGLSPNPPDRRAVIGQSVLFPLLLQYSEDTSLVSPANKKYFQISFLDQIPVSTALFKANMIDLKNLMSPNLL